MNNVLKVKLEKLIKLGSVVRRIPHNERTREQRSIYYRIESLMFELGRRHDNGFYNHVS